ncbi:hypothetical protein [Flavobacterium sp.]|uniref:hypothetical protein n=1 Tax=Flavobacterium sp. TaxID=239 RepID=UPI003753456E
MKKLLFIFSILSFYAFNSKEVAAVPQTNALLYADVIFLGQVIKSDSLGFYVRVDEEICNNTTDKLLFKKKEIYVSHDIRKRTRYSYGAPRKEIQMIFTLKYDAKTKTIKPFYYSFGLEVVAKENNSCYVYGGTKGMFVSNKETIKGIKLFKSCYHNLQGVWDHEFLKSKISDVEIKKAKESNAAAKIWIDEIETRNSYYKNLKK